LTPECFGDIDADEEEITSVPDTGQETDPRPQSTPYDVDSMQRPEDGESESRVPEIGGEQDVILVTPAPS
jgi:hypothetical protein